MARHLTFMGGMAAALVLAAAAAPAQERTSAASPPLADPTRPPAFLTGSGGQSPMTLTGPVLQSVLISADRRSAIISGERVDLGGKYGESRLTGLTEADAVLEGPQGRTVLKLVPSVEKQMTDAQPGDGERSRTPRKPAAPRVDRVPR